MEKQTIINAEQVEAKQESLNKAVENFCKQITPQEKQKFSAISQATEILNQNNLPFVLFVQLPHPDFYTAKNMQETHPLKNGIAQYNNMERFMERDLNGNFIVKAESKISIFTIHLACAIVGFFSTIWKSQSFLQIMDYFSGAMQKQNDWIERWKTENSKE